ncbi:hypothetical protein EV699_10996 [Plasticicumulans lactativorans]|uniref:Uncharacterized protein n=1 Tax=Plasticicumulans lactativorans TaxID=1133106 RepID=A0A4R2L2E3_9GAMM|nr:hypothetical protein [Plasticicumulans lactativorans]TCO81254.1 hypothetical protein EV699_10996 [Plasticicumulans lactativorans]
MITFDSPFERCPVCNEYVLLDCTQVECAKEHHCAVGQKCPLLRYFEGKAFVAGAVGPQRMEDDASAGDTDCAPAGGTPPAGRGQGAAALERRVA